MSQSQNPIFDELAKLMTNAAGAAQGVTKEMEALFRSQGQKMLNEMDLVSREEFEAVKEMAAKARLENEELKARLSALEEALSTATSQKGGKKS